MRYFCRVLFLLLFFQNAFALVVTSPDMIVLSDLSSSATLTLTNSGKQRGYVKMFAGPSDETCFDSDDKTCFQKTADVEKNIRFVPDKFILEPGQKRAVKVSWSGDSPDNIQHFTVGGVNHSEEAIISKKSENDGGPSFQTNISVIYGMHVFVMPKNFTNVKPELKISSNDIRAVNNSSSIVFFKPSFSCKEECKSNSIKSRYILANNGTLTLPNYPDVTEVKGNYFNVKTQKWEKFSE